jgi:hypothetical protein
MWLEGLGKVIKIIHHIGYGTHDLACSIVPYPLCYRMPHGDASG